METSRKKKSILIEIIKFLISGSILSHPYPTYSILQYAKRNDSYKKKKKWMMEWVKEIFRTNKKVNEKRNE